MSRLQLSGKRFERYTEASKTLSKKELATVKDQLMKLERTAQKAKERRKLIKDLTLGQKLLEQDEKKAMAEQEEKFMRIIEKQEKEIEKAEKQKEKEVNKEIKEIFKTSADIFGQPKRKPQLSEQDKKSRKETSQYIREMLSTPADLFEPEVKQKTIFTNEDVTVSTRKFLGVAETVSITIDEKVDTSDLTVFMKKMSHIVIQQLVGFLEKYKSFKVVFELDVVMSSEKLNKNSTVAFSSGSVGQNTGAIVHNQKNLYSLFHTAMEAIIGRVEAFQRLTSDWMIESVAVLYMKIAKYVPASGSSYIDLPARIKNKKCCINIENNDERCFEYSVLLGKHIDTMKDMKHLQRVTKYKPYENTLKFEDIEFPVKVDDVQSFEEQNQIAINVFGLDENEDITILHTHSHKSSDKIINLLLITKEEKTHYVYVKNLNALFLKDKCNNFICDRCLCRFSKQSAFDAHTKKNKCDEYTGVAVQTLPMEGFHEVYFKNTAKQLRVPFVLYADGESLLKRVDQDEKEANSVIYQEHQYRHIGVKLVSEFPDKLQDEYVQFDGDNCVLDFLNYCLDTQQKCFDILWDKTHQYYVWDSFSLSDRNAYRNATECHICSKPFKPLGSIKVLDHCHITGKYRGPAHQTCNLEYNYKSFKLPIIFHNLKGYDSHFLLQFAGLLKDRIKGKNLSVIPTTMEKYLSFTIDKCVFLDSAQFMASSLESLVSALNKVHHQNPESNVFQQFNEGFPGISSDLNNLLRQKGVFPYDWYDSEKKLTQTSLPSKGFFYNRLNEEHCKDEDYERACFVFQKAGCRSFFDYLSLYLKTDVLLLADVFEAFRRMCKNYYGLDPCHYYTAPGFSWDSMLKMTEVKIDCFQEGEDDMLDMVKAGMRGGMSVISHRYAQANNKYMKQYDETKESSHIMYLDANNLYGWAMSQYLPTGNYTWENVEVYTESYIHSIPSDAPRGCILEVDLDVPEEKHDDFNDYPLAPQSCYGDYSPLMLSIMEQYDIKQSAQTAKLISNLRNKKNYVLHYRNLQLYLSLGLKLKKVHRVLEFDQSTYLAKYIDFNTKKRAQSTNDFEKDLFKLFNNSIFGKTCENIEKRIDVNLCADPKKFLKSVSKPNFKNFKIFSEGLVACEMGKTQIKYDKPMIVGMCILDLSKHLMYNFHYNTMKKQYGEKCKLLFTDTDSLCYHIKTEDVYEDMKQDADVYDFSDYPKDHPLHSDANKKIIGKFKDEASGKPIIEFCGLRAKMYCFLTDEDKTKAVAKGCKKNVIKTFKMANYKDCLFGNTKEQLQQKCSANFIRQKNHQVHSVRITKVSLSGLDDKRYILSDNIHTLAHGHYKTQ